MANGCQEGCLTYWGRNCTASAITTLPAVPSFEIRTQPFVPAANELPSGFWDILTRDDGRRQWAYKGFAAYTYVGDKKPGDKTANDIYDILVDGDLKRDIYETGVVKNTDSAAMLWAYIEP